MGKRSKGHTETWSTEKTSRAGSKYHHFPGPWSPEVTLSVIIFSKCYLSSSGKALSDSQQCAVAGVVLPAPR